MLDPVSVIVGAVVALVLVLHLTDDAYEKGWDAGCDWMEQQRREYLERLSKREQSDA